MELTPDIIDQKKKHSPDFLIDLKPPKTPVLKSSLRMRYLAEVDVLKRDLGGLEDVRIRMGLSRRKICQLLLVDPSAWTRWTRDETKVPPHVWKMLQLINPGKDLFSQSTSASALMEEQKRLKNQILEQQKKIKRLYFQTIGLTCFVGFLFLWLINL